jgi:hypothetical protein
MATSGFAYTQGADICELDFLVQIMSWTSLWGTGKVTLGPGDNAWGGIIRGKRNDAIGLFVTMSCIQNHGSWQA